MRRTMMTVIPLLALAVSSSPAQAQDSWRVSEVSGDVRITESGRSRAATRGALLASGSTITAGARARAVLVRGRQYVTVSPNTQLRVSPPPQPQSRGVIQMITDWGSALFRVDRREAPHFGVQTPYLAAVVRGTTFTVTVGPSGASVQVTEGAGEVSTLDGGASDLVRPGMIASVGASDLYQLTINGDQERVIRSRNAPAAGAVTVPAPAQPASSAPTTIAQGVGEPPVDLEDTTRGLVRGEAGIELAMLQTMPPQSAPPTPPPPPPVVTVPTPPPATDTAAPPPATDPTPPPPATDPTPPPPPPATDPTPPPPPPATDPTPPPPPPATDPTPPPPPPATDPTPPPPPPATDPTPPPPPPATDPTPPPPDPGDDDHHDDNSGPGNGDDRGDHNGDGHPDNGDNGNHGDNDGPGRGHDRGDHNGDGHPDNGDNGSRGPDRGPPDDPRGRPPR